MKSSLMGGRPTFPNDRIRSSSSAAKATEMIISKDMNQYGYPFVSNMAVACYREYK